MSRLRVFDWNAAPVFPRLGREREYFDRTTTSLTAAATAGTTTGGWNRRRVLGRRRRGHAYGERRCERRDHHCEPMCSHGCHLLVRSRLHLTPRVVTHAQRLHRIQILAG